MQKANINGNRNIQVIGNYTVNLYIVYNGVPECETRRPRTVNDKGGDR